MSLSQRNRFSAQITSVQAGSATHRVLVQIGDVVIESIMTSDDAEKLHLKAGDPVVVTVKPIDVALHRARRQASAAGS